MRDSRVLRIMREGGVALSIKCNFTDASEAEMAAAAGFDCIWIDLEHVPCNMTTVNDFVRAAKIYDCDILTRVSRGSYSDLIRPFEADSTGIMVPHVMSAEDAKRVVYYTKFHPVGRRPIDGGNADCDFGYAELTDYMKHSNDERFVVVQIEDPEPMAELEEICALPGIDVIFFGPGDFSQGIGKPGQFNDEELIEARRLVAETARKHGKFAGTVGSPSNYEELAALGYQYINLGSDVFAWGDYCRQKLKAVKGRNV